MINSVVLVGRLTRDVELKKTKSNLSVATFTLACDRRFGRNQGDGSNQQADFISCVAWRQSADFLAQYGKKGNIVAVEGHISTRSYDGQDGKKVYVTEVTCENVQLLSRSERSEAPAPAPVQNKNYNTFTPSSEPAFMNDVNDDFDNTPSLDISSDDLPFY